jgi:hypothetical protein
MMQDDDFPLDEFSDRPEQPEPEPDPNALGSILTKALKSIQDVGGLERARLSDLVGRETYESLLSKPRVADAIDAYLSASPQTKRAAGRMLASHIARGTDHPEVLDRIERELEDTFADGYASASSPVKSLEPAKVRAQQKSGQRAASPDLMELARNSDASGYIKARLTRVVNKGHTDMADESFFSQAPGINTLYADKEGDSVADVRFCLCRYGECVNKVLERFWQEQPSSGFTVCPIFSHGLPPGKALSTARSIAAALQVIELEPGNALTDRWRELARDLGVPWPKHLQQVA